MEQTVAVGDVMDRTYVGVSEGDDVAGAAALMRDEGRTSAVVLRGGTPVGLLREADIIELVADARDPEQTTVADVMTESVPTVSTDARLSEAVEIIAETDVRRAVVTEGDEVTGVLTEHDIVAARSLGGPEQLGEIEGEATELQDAEYAEQGVCEVCGALSRTLQNQNGQLICGDCIEL